MKHVQNLNDNRTRRSIAMKFLHGCLNSLALVLIFLLSAAFLSSCGEGDSTKPIATQDTTQRTSVKSVSDQPEVIETDIDIEPMADGSAYVILTDQLHYSPSTSHANHNNVRLYYAKGAKLYPIHVDSFNVLTLTVTRNKLLPSYLWTRFVAHAKRLNSLESDVEDLKDKSSE